MKLSHDGKSFDLLSNSLNQFLQEMYGDQSGEFVFGYWGLKGLTLYGRHFSTEETNWNVYQ